MNIKEVSITAIDFNQLKPEDVFKWLEQFGFLRYVEKNYIIPSKSIDPRYPPDYVSDSPEGLYTSMIVPQSDYNQTMFIIRKYDFDRIKESFEESLQKQRNVKGEKIE